MSNYYEAPDTRAWDAYCDEADERDEEPTAEGFDSWMEEQEDRAEDAAIERAEQDRDFDDMDRDYGDEY